MRGPSVRTWQRIKERYHAAESVSAIAARYKTTRGTIRRRAQKESWVIDATQLTSQVIQNSATSPQELSRAVRANVVNLATEKSMENPSIATTVDDLATVLKKQVAFASEITTLAEAFLEDVKAERVTHLPHASRGALLLEVIAVCASAQTYTRLCGGLKAGQPNTIERPKVYGKRFTIVTPPKPERDEEEDAS